jgi:hypothetical protein
VGADTKITSAAIAIDVPVDAPALRCELQNLIQRFAIA